MIHKTLRPLITLAGFIFIWWAVTAFTSIPPFMLPSPQTVLNALIAQRETLMMSTFTTFAEIVLGLIAGTVLGAGLALVMVFSPLLQRWLMPLLVLSQAIPVFALAPLLGSGPIDLVYLI